MYNNFSPNMLKTYQTCPKKFNYKYILDLSMPTSNLPFEKGKKIHALANYYLKKINITKIEKELNDEERHLWNLLLNNSYFQMDAIKSEYQLSCKINNFWIGGRIDAIVKNNENYYILDYKTGSIPQNPEYDYQTMIYLLTLSKKLNSKNNISFVYINLKENSNYIIKFNEQFYNKYEEKIVDICNQINSEQSYSPNYISCQKCEYNKICKRLNDSIVTNLNK